MAIQVVKVKPKYTNQRCSDCGGHISNENRPSHLNFVVGFADMKPWRTAMRLGT
ncbi:zinc ribbon domain-containing protein [Polycladomyces zharkentensis]|uniref:zinc ribbon domain-containing protein n=1 Tax=Polycladomyces zharkentensis TaxID=2807616 RepID=UPI003AF32BB4